MTKEYIWRQTNTNDMKALSVFTVDSFNCEGWRSALRTAISMRTLGTEINKTFIKSLKSQ